MREGKAGQTGLTVVTASVDPLKTLPWWRTWREQAAEPFRLVMVVGGQGKDPGGIAKEVSEQLQDGDALVMRDIDGTIPAFFAGVQEAWSEGDPGIIACLHDDLEILGGTKDNELGDLAWDVAVKQVFTDDPDAVLAGFGGGTGLGAADIYQTPYDPMQLARQDFVSNLVDAENHGTRYTYVRYVACLDGFSQIGRADFIYEAYKGAKDLGIVHHAYDSLFGAWARKAGKNVLMVPVSCWHHGGTTAVGSKEYNEWALGVNEEGDAGFWKRAHEIMYEECKGVLPFSVKE